MTHDFAATANTSLTITPAPVKDNPLQIFQLGAERGRHEKALAYLWQPRSDRPDIFRVSEGQHQVRLIHNQRLHLEISSNVRAGCSKDHDSKQHMQGWRQSSPKICNENWMSSEDRKGRFVYLGEATSGSRYRMWCSTGTRVIERAWAVMIPRPVRIHQHTRCCQ